MDEGAARKQRTDEIIADDIRTVGAIYMAWQLEELRLFDVVDRLVERFAQGMLPIRDSASSAVLERYCRDRDERLARHERFALYGQILGSPQDESLSVATNRDFNALWLAFLSTVTELDRQQPTAAPSGAQSPSLTSEDMRLAGRRLAANATFAIARATPHAPQRLVDETWQALEILKLREILSAYGVQSHWALIDRVAASDLAASVPDIARHFGAASLPAILRNANLARLDGLRVRAARRTDTHVYASCARGRRQLAALFTSVVLEPDRPLRVDDRDQRVWRLRDERGATVAKAAPELVRGSRIEGRLRCGR